VNIVEELPMMRRVYLSLLFLFLSSLSFAADVELNPNHPQQYEVVRGDTLWDISGKFLRYPWHWPTIWQANSQIENPHLIYPGDLLTLVYRDGQPFLELSRGPTLMKLSPEIREIVTEAAISTIPLDAIQAFLTRPEVLAEETLTSAPYIVASSEERLISGAGDNVYVRGDIAEGEKHFSVFEAGQVYTDSETQEVLGYEAIYKGDAWLVVDADVDTVTLHKTTQEVLVGDRLLPALDSDADMNFFPRTPDQDISGAIISVFGGVSQVGQYQVVVLDRGARNGLEKGHVLSVYQVGETILDSVTPDRKDTVKLPDEHAGEAMVFKVFEKVSYAIVMKATRAIHIADKVVSAQ